MPTFCGNQPHAPIAGNESFHFHGTSQFHNASRLRQNLVSDSSLVLGFVLLGKTASGQEKAILNKSAGATAVRRKITTNCQRKGGVERGQGNDGPLAHAFRPKSIRANGGYFAAAPEGF
jgi:hypothetical protein